VRVLSVSSKALNEPSKVGKEVRKNEEREGLVVYEPDRD
jgi:hypothetical protein